ncbi:hypothetical protein F4775DRAFT_599583 [Biscogniauxia sp. FL1348]|nr:hypothetical protein F4775DRAFT_599583 [Biscogniauxia sp. FL1348]
MPSDTGAVPAETRPTMLTNIGHFLYRMLCYFLYPMAVLLAIMLMGQRGNNNNNNGKKDKKKQAVVEYPRPEEQPLWDELVRIYSEELMMRIKRQANLPPPPPGGKRLVYLVLHGVARELDCDAVETDIVGAYSSLYAANIRVLTYTRDLIQEVYHLDRVEDAEQAEDFWWCTDLEGQAGTQFLGPSGAGHNVAAVIVEITDSGFTRGTRVAHPCKHAFGVY